MQNPMAILLKAAVILPEDNFMDILPVSWELLLESDSNMVATAGKTAVRVSKKYPISIEMRWNIGCQYCTQDVSEMKK